MKYIDHPGLLKQVPPRQMTFPVIRKSIKTALVLKRVPPRPTNIPVIRKSIYTIPVLKETPSRLQRIPKIGKKEIRSTPGLGSAVVRSADQRKYISAGMKKRMETARQNLQPEQLWKLKQEPALITDPNSDVGKCI
ncbi:hypothetical protein TNCV_3615561 [Trichonephila clavipes]|nr:hypothetical protein TNCV_3615561 [Trichonephila clavipes]